MSIRNLNIFTSRTSPTFEHDDSRSSTSRPPTYLSSITASPRYESGSDLTARQRSWAASPSSSSSPTSWEMLDRTDPALTDTSGTSRTSLDAPSPSGSPHRYLYYRLYTEDGAIPSRKSLYSSDRYLGCIPATSVSPPHTAASIKRYLCRVEKITHPSTASLFVSALDQTPIEDEVRVAILAFAGPGSMPHQPLALVVKLPTADIRSWKMARLKSLIQPSTPLEPRYLYYRLYTEDGEVRCKSAKFTEPYLGRIDADLVVPPHTVASLKRCITKVEGIGSYLQADLFVELESEYPMDEGPIPILAGDCPGTPDKPMALVFSTSKVMPADCLPSGHSEFTLRIKAKQDCDYSSSNSKFLDCKKDELLYTDGRSRSELFRGGGGGRISARNVRVLQAVNAAGSTGFVMKNTMEFC